MQKEHFLTMYLYIHNVVANYISFLRIHETRVGLPDVFIQVEYNSPAGECKGLWRGRTLRDVQRAHLCAEMSPRMSDTSRAINPNKNNF